MTERTRTARAAICRRAAMCRQSEAIEAKASFWLALNAKYMRSHSHPSVAELRRFCASMRGSLASANPFDGASQFRLSTRLRWLREWRKIHETISSQGVR